ncbi:hypoxanthine phosphoribosyltransferase [Pseudoteredinibacter isoporae]|nr:hypoxanthine phosphoribosyltransferase [Pseudoteredinibacter isoporae]NIB22586.1 hypoxanthine phosphoribosyltransferase [Pseudoteredinibacter isoporae]
MEKTYISPQSLYEDSFKLAAQIFESGFRPNYIVGVWRGGTPVGIVVQELLEYCGVESDHIAIRTSSYDGIGKRSDNVRVHGLGYIVDKINAEDSLLIVDDIYDSGLSVQAVLRELKARCRKNTPADVRVATLYYKPKNNKTDSQPDFYVHESEEWLVFPHEILGLNHDEIQENKAGLGSMMDKLREWAPAQD